MCSQLLTWPTDQPRHATNASSCPVDPSSPPIDPGLKPETYMANLLYDQRGLATMPPGSQAKSLENECWKGRRGPAQREESRRRGTIGRTRMGTGTATGILEKNDHHDVARESSGRCGIGLLVRIAVLLHLAAFAGLERSAEAEYCESFPSCAEKTASQATRRNAAPAPKLRAAKSS